MSDQISSSSSSSPSSTSLLDQPPPDSSSSSSSSSTTATATAAAATNTTSSTNSAIDAALSLTRNSSLSKLNAKAPEFVPKKPPTPPLTPPLPTGGDPRVLIAASPPPPPPPAMVHVYPPPPPLSPSPPPPPSQQVNSPFPVMPLPPPPPHHPRGGNDHHHHHHHRGGGNDHRNDHHQHRSNDHRNDHRNDHHRKHHQRGSNGEQSEGVDKENNSNAASKNSNNGLSDESTLKLINQVEFYFSDVNLATTDHLIRFINKDPEGFVPISVVSAFKKIKALINSNSQLAAVLKNSTKLVVSEDGKKVKRLHPLTDMEELQARIIVAENLPDDHCHQNLMKVFSTVGSVKSIRTCQPQPSNNGASSASRQSKNDNAPYCNKVHAFVEYETIELAEKAIAELNDEGDWRNGLRLRSLLKQGSKTAQARGKKSGNEGEVTCEEEDASTSEQYLNEKQSEDLSGQPDIHTNEHGEEQSVEKEGGQKKSRNRGRGKGRGRGHQNHHNHHQNNRGHHVGSPPINHAMNGEHPIVAKQQPPGPRMPDGTRGFSMGRGRPVAVNTTA